MHTSIQTGLHCCKNARSCARSASGDTPSLRGPPAPRTPPCAAEDRSRHFRGSRAIAMCLPQLPRQRHRLVLGMGASKQASAARRLPVCRIQMVGVRIQRCCEIGHQITQTHQLTLQAFQSLQGGVSRLAAAF